MDNEITPEEIAAVFEDRERLARENEKLRAHFTKMREMRKDDMEIVGEYMEQNGKLRLEAQRIRAELEETRAALDSKTEELNLIVLRWANRLKEAGIFDDSKSLGDYIDEGVQALAERQRLVSPSVQVEPTDADIDRMAEAACNAYWGKNKWASCIAKDAWRYTVRATWRVRPETQESQSVAVDPTDAQVEALAKVMCETPWPNGVVVVWDETSQYTRQGFIIQARAAYAHIGAEVANLREQVNGLCEIGMNAMAALSEVVGLRQELKQARAEANSATCAKQEHAVTIEGLIEKIEGLEIELLKVRAERQTRPVKVRFDCTWKEMFDAFLPGPDMSYEEHALSYFAAHAVIDLPADVPSPEEIDNAWDLYCEDFHEDKNDCALTPVRFTLEHLSPWLQPRTVTAEQIEKAARGLYESYVIWSWGRAGDWTKESEVSRNLWKDRAIAAFAAAGFNVEVVIAASTK